MVQEIHRHAKQFTVVGNHVAQHRSLSLTAVGLAVHIQSLPPGSPIGIKTLAKRWPEGALRIAAALRELVEHGYLRREKIRGAGGRILTRTVFCNNPEAAARGERAEVREEGAGENRPASSRRPRAVEAATTADARVAATGTAEAPPVWGPSAAEPQPASAPAQSRTVPPPGQCGAKERKPLPPVPQPWLSRPDLVRRAVELLTGLRSYVSELRFSSGEIEHLTPGVVAWLERDVTCGEVRRALFTGLPEEGLRRPAAFVAYRLNADLPPPLPRRPSAVVERLPERHPLRNCEDCDRGYRGSDPERCPECLARADQARLPGEGEGMAVPAPVPTGLGTPARR
ncbi:helix-turn-helix domain-containing protein [Streptomyces fragilis]|uniref:Helix-turn-helix domain-containing protein n=1 Tax=Streptomyces fragilis TaxID=67301 RepID=A0ABV2YEF3_9ACTN|nr:helix-turn-helix domain-containing protein [Streptomyces fragilis]